MNKINFKREITSSADAAVARVEAALKAEGFGILTRIDFHKKIKEKLNQDMLPLIVLGACKPSLAYEAIRKNPDVASLLPCNVVVRDIGNGKVSIEAAKATAMMAVLGDAELMRLAAEADGQLERAIEKL